MEFSQQIGLRVQVIDLMSSEESRLRELPANLLPNTFYHTGDFTETGRVRKTFGDELPSLVGGCVLDVGCSWGITTLELAELYPASFITGIDIYQHRVEAARKMVRDFGPSNSKRRIRIQQGDGYLLDGFDHQFDAVFCMNNLLFSQDGLSDKRLESIARRFHAVLRPGGHFLLSRFDLWADLERTDDGWHLKTFHAGKSGDVYPLEHFLTIARLVNYSGMQ